MLTSGLSHHHANMTYDRRSTSHVNMNTTGDDVFMHTLSKNLFLVQKISFLVPN